MKHRHRVKALIIILLIVTAFILTYIFTPGLDNLSSPEYLREYILDLGPLGYVMYVLFVILSIPLPIPTGTLALAGGYIFGTLIGTSLVMVGLVIGASVSFLLVRKFGRPLVEMLVDKRHIIHFNHLFKKRGPVFALIAYMIPIFPSDATDFLLALSF